MIVEQCIGAKEYEQAVQYTKYLLNSTWLYMFLFNLGIFILLNPILKLYHLSDETYLLSYTVMVIHILGWITVWTLSFTLPNMLRASGDVKFPMMISTFSMFVFRIGFSYIFAYGLGIGVLSVWFAMIMDWTFRCVCFFWRWKSNKWKQYTVI